MGYRWVIALVLVLLLGSAQMGCAQTEDKPETGTQPMYTVEGVITFLEIDGSVVVQTGKGPDRIVYIKEYTRITRNGKPAQRADIKPRDQVWVSVGPMRDALEMKATGP